MNKTVMGPDDEGNAEEVSVTDAIAIVWRYVGAGVIVLRVAVINMIRCSGDNEEISEFTIERFIPFDRRVTLGIEAEGKNVIGVGDNFYVGGIIKATPGREILYRYFLWIGDVDLRGINGDVARKIERTTGGVDGVKERINDFDGAKEKDIICIVDHGVFFCVLGDGRKEKRDDCW